MNDFTNSIISSLFECVDQVGANLVAHTYQNLVNQFSPFLWVMVSIFVGIQFLLAMNGLKSFADFLVLTFKTIFLMMLAVNYQYFCLFIYDVVTIEPLVILKCITLNGHSGSESVSHALDNFINTGFIYANKLAMMGGWSNLSYLVFSFLVLAATLLTGIFAAGLIILAKCASIILLALSPLFIFCGLFEMTKGIFESYVRHLITYALIPILTCTILMILFNVSQYVIQFMNGYPKLSFIAILPFLILCGIQVYLLMQVFSKASALGGGFVLKSWMSTIGQARDNMQNVAGKMMGGSLGKAAFQKWLASSGLSRGSQSPSSRARNRFGNSP